MSIYTEILSLSILDYLTNNNTQMLSKCDGRFFFLVQIFQLFQHPSCSLFWNSGLPCQMLNSYHLYIFFSFVDQSCQFLTFRVWPVMLFSAFRSCKSASSTFFLINIHYCINKKNRGGFYRSWKRATFSIKRVKFASLIDACIRTKVLLNSLIKNIQISLQENESLSLN